MCNRHKEWTLVIRDLNEYDPYLSQAKEDRFPVEIKLHDIFFVLNEKYRDLCGVISPQATLILREGEGFEYTINFKVQGGVNKGFSKEMFNPKASKKMNGFLEFQKKSFEII